MVGMNRTALDVEATRANPPLTDLVDLYLLRCQVEGEIGPDGHGLPATPLAASCAPSRL